MNKKKMIKKTPPTQFSILITDSNLRENELHETSKRTAFYEAKACSPWDFFLGLLLLLKLSLGCKSKFFSNFASSCFYWCENEGYRVKAGRRSLQF